MEYAKFVGKNLDWSVKDMNNELKPCPFCGGKAEMLNYSENEWLVHCIQCDGMVERWRETEEEAIEQWNRRIKSGKID